MFNLFLRVWSWWIGELRACLPRLLRRKAGPCLELALDRQGAALSLIGPGPRRRLGALDPETATAAEARRLLGGMRVGAAAIVRLAPGAALRARVSLPSAAATDLRAALASEMDRHTPFATEAVRFDFRVEGADPDLERIFVEMEVARRENVEAAAALASRLGFRPARVAGAEADKPGERPFDLLPPERRVRASRTGTRLAGALAALLLVLSAGALAAWFDRQERILAVAEARLDSLRAAAGAAAGAADRTAALRARAGALVARKAASPLATRLLDEATARLPDDSWAESLEFGGGTLRIAGRSAEAAGVLGALEASPFFAGARFTAPVIRDAATGLERFEASVEIVTPAAGASE